MVEWLRSGSIPAPKRVETPPLESESGLGSVTASFEEGSLIVSSPKGELVRLAWEPRDAFTMPSDRRRPLEPGEYRLVGYRVVRRDAAGARWHVSATGKMRKLVVEDGRDLRVEVDERVHVAQRFDGKSAGMEIRGEGGAGLTIYREGKRIGVPYRVLGEGGAELARGDMRYG